MKIYLDKILTEDLSKYTDEQLEEWDICRESQPILIKNLFIEKNKVGHLVIGFESINHKYLKINYGISTSAREEDNATYWTRGLEIETFKTYKDLKTLSFDLRLPVSRTTLWLEPDTKEENDMLSGSIAQLSRWSHEIVIVPFDCLEMDVEDEDKIKEVEEDVVYEYEL